MEMILGVLILVGGIYGAFFAHGVLSLIIGIVFTIGVGYCVYAYVDDLGVFRGILLIICAVVVYALAGAVCASLTNRAGVEFAGTFLNAGAIGAIMIAGTLGEKL